MEALPLKRSQSLKRSYPSIPSSSICLSPLFNLRRGSIPNDQFRKKSSSHNNTIGQSTRKSVQEFIDKCFASDLFPKITFEIEVFDQPNQAEARNKEFVYDIRNKDMASSTSINLFIRYFFNCDWIVGYLELWMHFDMLVSTF